MTVSSFEIDGCALSAISPSPAAVADAAANNGPATAANFGLGRKTASGVLASLVLLAVVGTAITLSSWKSGYADATEQRPSDIELFRAKSDRMLAGAGYYDAAQLELNSRGYPTSSPFNWRTPLPIAAAAWLPVGWAKGLLVLLAIALLLAGFDLLAREGSLAEAAAGGILLSGAIMPCVLGDIYFMPELWSGILIALSICLSSRDARLASVLAGIAALFVRELAAPYVLIAMGVAATRRDRRELGAWLVGLAAYGGFYAYHLSQVIPRLGTAGQVGGAGWMQVGGLPFLIARVQMNAYFLLLPQWCSAVLLVAALLGIVGWTSRAGRTIGLTLLGYALCFSLVGHDYNQYWGSMIAPIVALAAGRSYHGLRRLADAAFASRRSLELAA